jgi:hypothetical protein
VYRLLNPLGFVAFKMGRRSGLGRTGSRRAHPAPLLYSSNSMICLGKLKRMWVSVAMIFALIVPSVPLASGQSSCRMACSKEKQTCHSCCAGDPSCGVSKSKSEASRPLVALQRTVSWGSSCQAVLTRTVLLVLPSTTKLRSEWATREFKHPGSLAANCILLI